MAVNRFQQVVRPEIGSQFVPLNLPMEQIGAQVQAKDQQQKQAIQQLQEDAGEMKDLFNDLHGIDKATAPDGLTHYFGTDVDASRIKAGIAKKIDGLASKAVETDLTDGFGEIGSEWAQLEQEVKQQTTPGGLLYDIDQQRQNVNSTLEDIKENYPEIQKDPSLLLNVHENFARMVAGTNKRIPDSPMNAVRNKSLENAVMQSAAQGRGDIAGQPTGMGEAVDPAGILRKSMDNLSMDKYMQDALTPQELGYFKRSGWSGIGAKKIRKAADYAIQNNTALQEQLKREANYKAMTGEIDPDARGQYIQNRVEDLKGQMVAEYKQDQDESKFTQPGKDYAVTSDYYNIQPSAKSSSVTSEPTEFSKAVSQRSPELAQVYGTGDNETIYNYTEIEDEITVRGNKITPLHAVTVSRELADGEYESETVEQAGAELTDKAVNFNTKKIRPYRVVFRKGSNTKVSDEKLRDKEWVEEHRDELYTKQFVEMQGEVTYKQEKEDGGVDIWESRDNVSVAMDISDPDDRRYLEGQSKLIRDGLKETDNKWENNPINPSNTQYKLDLTK